MCGISGIVNGSVSIMVDQQIHRGPDNKQISKIADNIQFGHNRLSIIDLTAAGNQPMVSESGRYVLTYNGEIYNYKDFGLPGNDAAVLLQLIERDKLSAVLSAINGMYAFALYDKQKQTISLVVDRIGQKPLYYYCDVDKFAFASSPSALLHLRDKWKVNELALASYWKLGSVMYDSIWDGIKKVNASECITYNIQSGSISTNRYWQPTYQGRITDSDIEELILDSVRKVAVSDVPIYIFLSGGVDSTLVASQFEGGNAIHLQSPELPYAQQVAERFGINLRIVTPAEYNAAGGMEDYVSKCGEPSMAGLTPWITSQETAKFCKVAITANGADELFFGYDRTSEKVSGIQLDHIFRSVVDCPVYKPDIDPRLSSGRWLELMTYVQHDLNKTLDFASMAHSLELRSPFLDHRLVEMALSVPQERMGRKQILKDMLHRMAFLEQFTGRPKMGFSLYTPIPKLDTLQDRAYQWCLDNGWLKVTGKKVGKRDMMYLKASAFGFQQWWKYWEGKIN